MMLGQCGVQKHAESGAPNTQANTIAVIAKGLTLDLRNCSQLASYIHPPNALALRNAACVIANSGHVVEFEHDK